MSLTKRWLDELNDASEQRGECVHGVTGECERCEEEYYASDEPDYGGAFDGFVVSSDADPGL